MPLLPGNLEVLYYHFLPGLWTNTTPTWSRALEPRAQAAAVQAKIEQLNKFKELYDDPFVNAAMTFIEPFPMGLIVTLISAVVLRRKPRAPSSPSASPASS